MIVIYNLKSIRVNRHDSVFRMLVAVGRQAGSNEEVVVYCRVICDVGEETNMICVTVAVELTSDDV